MDRKQLGSMLDEQGETSVVRPEVHGQDTDREKRTEGIEDNTTG